MERGVVVGGLMICGSFLLAASLNRSAVEETPPAESAAVPTPPLTPPLPAMNVDPAESVPCTADANDANPPAAGDEPQQSELPGNGRERCSQ
jgi:hypothetical protein